MTQYQSHLTRPAILILMLIGCLSTCSNQQNPYNTTDLIEFISINPGKTTIIPVSDIFYAEKYNLKIEPNRVVSCEYNSEENYIKLTPEQGFSGVSLIRLKNGRVPLVLPIIVKTRTAVTFRCAVPEKDVAVFVMGNFNNWSRTATPMSDDDNDGVFTRSVLLDDGIYEYQFVIGNREIYDPENPVKVDNGFGYFNSLLQVHSGVADSIPELYFLQSNDPKILLFTVDSKGAAGSLDYIALINNQPYPENYIKLQERTVCADLSALKADQKEGVFRIVATNNHLPGNVISVWLNGGSPAGNGADFKWQDATIYSLMIDRFANGNIENDRPVNHPELDRRANFQGGDFAGLTEKIESGYFNDIGVNTLWISPVNQTTDNAWREYPEPHRYYTGYHGYWPVSPKETEPRFGSPAELRKLVESAHQHGLKILLDFVSNHVHIEHVYFQENRDWFGSYELPDGSYNIRRWDEYRLTTWFDTFLPSFDYENSSAALSTMTDNAVWWLEKTGIDGFRHDATKHVPYIFWRELTRKMKSRINPQRTLGVYQIGETFGGDDLIKSYVNNGMLEAQFNMNQYFILRRLMTDPQSDFNELKAGIEKSLSVYGYNNLMGNIIGSHDQVRIMALLEGDLTLAENGVERAFREPPITVDEYATYLKERLLFCYLMTLPGVPIVFYGDEFGMTGANDPDNRRMMRFDDELSEWETEQLRAFRQLTKLRNEYSCLRSGDYLNLYTGKDVMIYTRGDSEHRLIVGFSKFPHKRKVTFALPDWLVAKRLESLLGNDFWRVTDNEITLEIPGWGYDILRIY